MASWTHIFSPTSVLEIKYGRNVPNLPQPTINSKIQRQDFLTKSGITMFIPDVLFDPIPAFSAGGEWSIGSGGQITGDHINQFIGNYSKGVRLSHAEDRRQLQPPALLHKHDKSRWTATSISTRV